MKKLSPHLDISIIILMSGFAIIVAAMILHISSMQSKLLKESALSTARIFSVVLSEVRTLYTEEVVNTAVAKGMIVTHNYQEVENAIPLPATFSMRLGELLGQHSDDVKIRLYSAYPFPWRMDTGGLGDEYSSKAWRELSKDQTRPYVEFVESDQGLVLRYATADAMRSACIECHNTHPQSPKRDWKVGDLRGILEVALPLKNGSQEVHRQIQNMQLIYSAEGVLMFLGIGFANYRVKLSRTALETRTEELEQVNTKLKNLSEIDALTGIPNRRCYNFRLNAEVSNARRSKSTLSMLVIDIDYFKQYNDSYGHECGDRVLGRVAELAQQSLFRESDFIARYGGEEFVVLLPFTETAGAIKMAETIRERIAADRIAHDAGVLGKYISVSIGIASQCYNENNSVELFQRADAALYKAKQRGRNCCVVDPAESSD